MRKYLNDSDFSMESIDIQIHTSLEDLKSLIKDSNTEYTKLQNEYNNAKGYGIESEDGVLTKMKDFIVKISKKIWDSIKKVFRWIGEKLGIIKKKEKVAKVKAKSIGKILTEIITDKIKSQEAEGLSTVPLNELLSKEQMTKVNTMFQSILFIEGDLSPKTLNEVYNSGYKEIGEMLSNIKKMTKDNNDVLHKPSRKPTVWKDVSAYNKVLSKPFDLNIRSSVQAEYGKLDGSNMSILVEVNNPSRQIPYNKFYYKTSKIKEIKDYTKAITKPTPLGGAKLVLMISDEILGKLGENIEMNNIMSLVETMEKTLHSKLSEATDKLYVDYIKNVLLTIPLYSMDKYLSSVITRGNIVTYSEYVTDAVGKKTKAVIDSDPASKEKFEKMMSGDEPFVL